MDEQLFVRGALVTALTAPLHHGEPGAPLPTSGVGGLEAGALGPGLGPGPGPGQGPGQELRPQQAAVNDVAAGVILTATGSGPVGSDSYLTVG